MQKHDLAQKQLWYTLGPSSLDKEIQFLEKGATGVRLTFSYGTPKIQFERAQTLQKASIHTKLPCLIVADIAGGKFRLGSFREKSSVIAKAGTIIHFLLAEETTLTDKNITLPIPNPNFFFQITKNSVFTIGDGSAVLLVTQVNTDNFWAEMIFDGVINPHRGLTIQNIDFRPPMLTSKDLNHIEHILSVPIYDVLALSFVSSADDLKKVHTLIKKAERDILLLSKVETLLGVENIQSICEHSDLVMAARGDLALAMPWIDLPDAVNQISSAAKTTSTPWILATQIMEGLERFTMPTRSEICDVAHWLIEGCFGLLLSYETCFGSKPLESVDCANLLLQRWGVSDIQTDAQI